MTDFPDIKIADLGKFFYKLAEKSRDVFWIRSADFNRQLYINPAYEKIWGRPCKELYDNPTAWIQRVVPEDREEILDTFNQQPKVGDTYVLNFRIVRPDQQIRTIQDTCFPLFDEAGECFGYAGVAKDITHDKQQLAELEEATRFFRFFAEKIQSVFWVRDPKCNKQLYVSPAYEKIWGRDCKTLYNDPESWIETLYEEDRDPHTADMRLKQLEQEGPNFRYEDRYRIVRPDGKIAWIKDVSFAIYDEHEEFIGFAGIAEDVTQSVLYEQQLQEAKLRAEVANQTKANFLAMMSHELRTPLNAILGMAQILQIKNVTPELQECVSVIQHAGNSLLALVNDILDFAKLEVGKLSFTNEPVDLQLLISQVIFSLSHQAKEKNLDLQVDYPDNIPTLVLGDAKRIRQVLVNLVGNALKFTDRGYIKIHVSCLNENKNRAILQLKVSDTGIGISKDKIDFVFEKFSQIDSIYQRKYQGTGLGLAITKELVEKMGGTIHLESELGVGSIFTLVIPFNLQLSALEKPINYSSMSKPQIKKNFGFKVLLVEDNSINQKIAKIMLEDVGCTVEILDTGQLAIDYLKRDAQFDIIFMDIGLPDMSGFDVVSAIRKENNLNRIPIVAMTAHILERDKQQCFSVGMNGVIAKPITHNDLIEVLEHWVVKEQELVSSEF